MEGSGCNAAPFVGLSRSFTEQLRFRFYIPVEKNVAYIMDGEVRNMNIPIYENFDLQIITTDEGYGAYVIQSPVGEVDAHFSLDFSQEELRKFFWISGRSLRKVRLKKSAEAPPPLTPRQFGQRLYNAVFAGPIRTQLRRSLDAVAGPKKGLRIRLRLSDVPELAELPWEYLYATDLDRELANATDTPVVRYLDLDQPEQQMTIRPPLHILGVVSNPKNVPPLKVEQEWRQLHDALDGLASRQLLTLERLTSPTLDALQARLRDEAVHVLHFIGHGDFDDDTELGVLFFEDGNRMNRLVLANQLATILREHDTLRLAFLNACQGAQGGRTNSFGGVAQKLVQQGVPSVLAMQFPVSDRAAITLAREFYHALARGYPVDAATSEARKKVYVEGSDGGTTPGQSAAQFNGEWGTPVLFTRSADNRILDMPEGDARPIIEHQDWEPETVLIPGGPFMIGSDEDNQNESPLREETLPDFRMGKGPVTNVQYAEFIKHNPEHPTPKKPDWFLRKPPEGKEDHPVVGVSWHDAKAYCDWLSEKTGRIYRLPSEEEWEKAARGRDGRRYPWSNEWTDDVANVAGEDTTPISEYEAGASPDGCLDMLGNVQEWTQTIGENNRPIHRGGSYRSDSDSVRCSARSVSSPESAVLWRGFRVMMQIVQTVSSS